MKAKSKSEGDKRLYKIIYADPPWRYKNWSMSELAQRGEKWARRMGRSPYDVMDTEDICKLPVGELAAKDCVLFLWVTDPKLEEAFKVINAWGFSYRTVAFTWVKTNKKRGLAPLGEHLGALMAYGLEGYFDWLFCFGLGFWTRANPEMCLLATRGHPKRVSNKVQQLCIAPRRDHSRKPDEIRDRIVELCGDLPRIELFARPPIPEGWDVWGDEVESDVIL